MKIHSIRSITLAAAFLAVGVISNGMAREQKAGEWKLSLGYVYRTFDDMELNARTFNNGATLTGNLAAGVVTVEDVVQFSPDYDTATIHTGATFGGADAEMDDASGVVLRSSNQLGDNFGGTWLDLSLVVLSQESNTRIGVGVTEVKYTDVVDDNDPADFNPGPPPNATGTWAGAVPTPEDLGQLRFDLDMNVLTHGIGISKTYQRPCWYFTGGVGPTLTLLDYDMARTERVVYDDANNTVLYNNQQRDDDMTWLGGIYGRIAAGYDVREDMSLQFGIRYDWIQDADTDFGTIDLSGLSGDIALTFKF